MNGNAFYLPMRKFSGAKVNSSDLRDLDMVRINNVNIAVHTLGRIAVRACLF